MHSLEIDLLFFKSVAVQILYFLALNNTDTQGTLIGLLTIDDSVRSLKEY